MSTNNNTNWSRNSGCGQILFILGTLRLIGVSCRVESAWWLHAHRNTSSGCCQRPLQVTSQVQRLAAAAGQCFRLKSEDAPKVYWASASDRPLRPTSVDVSASTRDCDKKFNSIGCPPCQRVPERRSPAPLWHESSADLFTKIITRDVRRVLIKRCGLSVVPGCKSSTNSWQTTTWLRVFVDGKNNRHTLLKIAR